MRKKVKSMLNIWTMDIVYLNEGNIETKENLKSGDFHYWLRENKLKVRYDYQHRAWAIKGTITPQHIKEIHEM